MNGISFGAEVSKPEETSVKEDWLTILKGLEREEIEEVLSHTFCDHCKVNLHARVQSVANRKFEFFFVEFRFKELQLSCC